MFVSPMFCLNKYRATYIPKKKIKIIVVPFDNYLECYLTYHVQLHF